MREPEAEQRTGSSAENESREVLATLGDALSRFAAAPSWSLAQEVVELLPLALCADLVTLSLRERRPAGRLHVVAASGLSARELSRLAFTPVTVAQARVTLASTPSNALSQELGLLWGTGRWLADESVVGMVFVGCRTRRLPGRSELSVLDVVAQRLTARAEKLGRSESELGRRAAALVRFRGVDHVRPSPLPSLRSREVQILELYGEGLGTREIAELLVISPHTVRTHVRNALRGLGVRSRQEAVFRLQQRQLLAPLGGARKVS